PMNQDAGPRRLILALQGALELFSKVDRALINYYGADRQHLIAMQVQAGGLHIHYNKALSVQGRDAQRRSTRQSFAAAALRIGEEWVASSQPGGECIHN